MRSETLPEEYATDAILAINHDRWETVGVLLGETYEFNENHELFYVASELADDY